MLLDALSAHHQKITDRHSTESKFFLIEKFEQLFAWK